MSLVRWRGEDGVGAGGGGERRVGFHVRFVLTFDEEGVSKNVLRHGEREGFDDGLLLKGERQKR